MSAKMNRAKKILVLGDSLTFGRPKYQITYDDTWPGLIETAGFKVFHRGTGGADSTAVLNEARHLYVYTIDEVSNLQLPFDLCLIQVGIVDCAPRIFPRKLNRIIGLFPGGGKLVTRLSRFGSLVRLVGKPWVSLKKFEKNILTIYDICSELATKVVFIEIAKPAHYLIDNSGDFSNVVHEYNSVLRNVLDDNYLPVFETEDLGNLLLPDGHHLTKDGHKRIADKILDFIQ